MRPQEWRELGRADTLSTGSNQGVVGHHIRLAALAVHLIKQLKGQLPFAGLLTGADEAGIGDDVALTATSNHVLAASAQLHSRTDRQAFVHKVLLVSHGCHTVSAMP